MGLKQKVTVYIDGEPTSVATIIALAADHAEQLILEIDSPGGSIPNDNTESIDIYIKRKPKQ